MSIQDVPTQLREEYSAKHLFTRRQKIIGLVTTAAVVAAVIYDWSDTVAVLVTISTVYFLLSTVDRAYLVFRGLQGGNRARVTVEQAYSIPDEDLPVYTVLLPAYREPDIVATLLEGVSRIDYPADKLDVYLILEADDEETISAFQAQSVHNVNLVVVPPTLPRTKPKACNHAMDLPSERSEYVTIFDADDIPDPLQLRKAVYTFANAPDDVAALQSTLSYYNANQNILTRWFSIEYDQWFSYVLPALSEANCIIPLGGSSNHIKTHVLWEVGGWDPYNVTEDADLGIRLARNGYRTLMLDSVTAEEANADALNWLRQRSRWYKGYLQTFVVHMRQPVRLYRELGLVPLLRMANITAGMPIACMVNVAFWALIVVWYAGRPEFFDNIFPNSTYYLSLLLFTAGNAIAVTLTLLTTRASGKPQWLVAALLIPGYWLLQAIGAIKSGVQLVYNPSYWEKTEHGLARKATQ
ncbi:glycosyltransferase [Mycobacterium sp. CVI_P3]|uniref:Glycosyltransferase n=1 Tax=Mycobacterium pinniadriaticum TaxID=2994102 RepID=A0ABT3SI85_9MYCO|nr:glycosyltransferase [Mycobacterium pinniadriaticum]MCX2932716.1 glycosyltransferase [Mycobacterium pinniadriaticum]MCX2939224.1 glycosyltransferase [Mycobacterium pinniadriaticum]